MFLESLIHLLFFKFLLHHEILKLFSNQTFGWEFFEFIVSGNLKKNELSPRHVFSRILLKIFVILMYKYCNFIHELGIFNLIYMYDVKLKYFYRKHDFFNALNIPYYNSTSPFCTKVNVSSYE